MQLAIGSCFVKHVRQPRVRNTAHTPVGLVQLRLQGVRALLRLCTVGLRLRQLLPGFRVRVQQLRAQLRQLPLRPRDGGSHRALLALGRPRQSSLQLGDAPTGLLRLPLLWRKRGLLLRMAKSEFEQVDWP